MSKHAYFVNGKWEDLTFRNKAPIQDGDLDLMYDVYVGDTLYGKVYQMYDGWTALAYKPGPMNLVEGFRTRFKAAQYIVRYTLGES